MVVKRLCLCHLLVGQTLSSEQSIQLLLGILGKVSRVGQERNQSICQHQSFDAKQNLQDQQLLQVLHTVVQYFCVDGCHRSKQADSGFHECNVFEADAWEPLECPRMEHE